MNKRTLIVILLSHAVAFSVASADNVPSETSIKQLLEVSQVRKILDGTMAQVDVMLTQMMQQLTQGQPVSPKIQKDIDEVRSETKALMKEMLDWNRLEPIYVRIYQKSFSQPEIDSLIVMYQTPGGQALLNKMPLVMRNSMAEMQELMKPVMERLQRKQQEIAAEIQKDKRKTGG
jgi:hypothetical protein